MNHYSRLFSTLLCGVLLLFGVGYVLPNLVAFIPALGSALTSSSPMVLLDEAYGDVGAGDAGAKVALPDVLVGEAELAHAEFVSSGVWPSSVVSSEVPDGVTLEVGAAPSFCADAQLEGSGFSYYFSASTAAPLVRGVHPGSCEEGAAGSGGAPVVDVELSALEVEGDSGSLLPVLLVSSGVLVLGGVSWGGGVLVVRHRRRRREVEADRAFLVERWVRAEAALSRVRGEVFAVEGDVLSRLDLPALFDVADPLTRAYLVASEEVAAAHLESPPEDSVLVDRFESRWLCCVWRGMVRS